MQIRLPAKSLGSGRALLEQISQEIQNQIIPQLEVEFDQICPPDQVLSLDLLEFDLGKIPPENWKTVLREKLKREILLQIHQKKETVSFHSSPGNSSVNLVSKLKSEGQSLLHFLQTGNLPGQSKMDLLHMAEVLDKIIYNSSGKISLPEVIIHHEKALFRLILHFGEIFQSKILPEFLIGFPENSPPIPLIPLSPNNLTRELILFWKFLLQRPETYLWNSVSLNKLWQDFLAQTNLKEQSEFTLPWKSTSDDTLGRWQELLSRLNLGKIPSNPFSATQSEPQNPDTDNGATKEGDLSAENFPQNLTKSPSEQDFRETTEEASPSYPVPKSRNERENVPENDLFAQLLEVGPDQLLPRLANPFIPLAGLALLAPFIPVFFEKVGLLDEKGNFSRPENQRRAACLLHYLACGQDEVPEFELALAKVLCGLDLSDLVWLGTPFSNLEKKEAQNLLEAVIGHWKQLKGSSPEALREGFLRRNGKLIFSENGPKLLVEAHTLDVLMAALPWGFSVIKFPWMEKMMFVEWG
ncbi:MAG: hypothetical protein H6581_24975 [Bacteroidia bacterium]|nr:hypothetical protein [Bacteroidia bacterium]